MSWTYGDPAPFAIALLSDSESLIDRYVNLEVDEDRIVDNLKKKVPSHLIYQFRSLLRDDQGGIDHAIQVLHDYHSKAAEKRFTQAHFLCTYGIASRNEAKLRKGIEQFESKFIKGKMIKGNLFEEILSFYSLLYLKIAWRKGMELYVDSEYIPREILPIEPLEEYTIPYWFLRDFYREQGEIWRYDPVFPESQNWSTDPENPQRIIA